MKRRKNDRQVLIPRNNRSSGSRNPRRNKPPLMYRSQTRNTGRNTANKPSGLLVFAMIIALIAFIIGAGVGVSLNMNVTTDEDAPHYQNVTKEMTTNVTTDESVYYSAEDSKDFNENQSVTENVSYV